MKNGLDMIYLAACALHDKAPEEAIVKQMDLEAVYKCAVRHSMYAITYFALEKLIKSGTAPDLIIDAQLLEKWKRAKASAIYKNVLITEERTKLFGFMEQTQIWYLPLKGILLQDYYPRFGMRQMADNDILFDTNGQESVRDYMVQNGYTVEQYGTGPHDVYKKGAGLNFEMHRTLYSDSTQYPQFKDYYADVFAHLIKDQDNAYGYHFSKEDFYIYCVAHGYKHFVSCGNGIRSLMDLYVYNSKEGDALDRAYIDREQATLRIDEYEKCSLRLAYKLFSMEHGYITPDSQALTPEEQKMLRYCLDSGTYGTPKNFVFNQISTDTGQYNVSLLSKLKYCMRRVIPSTTYYKDRWPFLYRYKVLIPFFLIYRFFHAIFFKGKRIFRELRTLFKTKE